jgi:subtilisin-like proprotein convertase family protein
MRVCPVPSPRLCEVVLLAFFTLPTLLGSSDAFAQDWVLETAEGATSNVGAYCSLELDAFGNPHVAHQDGTTSDLKYSRKIGGLWAFETADGSASNVGVDCSLELDSSGNPHVCYYEGGAITDLRYARKSAGVWTREVAAASANDVGRFISLALDASNNPHVSYQDVTAGDLKYARKTGGAWTIETADASVSDVGWFTSLGLDVSGNPHVSYFDNTSDNLKYARKSGGVWTIETVDGATSQVGSFTSLVLDGSGNPHVSYLDATNNDLKYARKSGGVWVIETADGSSAFQGDYNSLALDALGNPHVSYRDGTNTDLMYARKVAGMWTTEVVDASANSVGWFSSLALDALGNAHVAHQDAGPFDLKYAFIPGVLVDAPGTGATWAVGSSQTISWSYTGGLGSGTVDVLLSVDGGRTFEMIRDNARDAYATVRVPHAPTRFAQIKIVQSSPFVVGYSDSFFTIDATIALNKFEARVVGGAGADAKSQDPAFVAARAVMLAWETTPGREAGIRYRVERASGANESAVFERLHAEPLDVNEYLDGALDVWPSGGGLTISDTRYRLIAVNGLDEEFALGTASVGAALSEERDLAALPNTTRTGDTEIRFRVATERLAIDVTVFDASGRRVRMLAAGGLAPGIHSVRWDGRDDRGETVAPGVYFARLAWAGVARASERIIVVR